MNAALDAIINVASGDVPQLPPRLDQALGSFHLYVLSIDTIHYERYSICFVCVDFWVYYCPFSFHSLTDNLTATLKQAYPESGSFIYNQLGSKNIELFCEIRECILLKTSWLLLTKDDMQNSRHHHIMSEDNRFSLMGDSVMSDGYNVSLDTNLTIVTLTAELDGAMIFCGSNNSGFLGNFTIKVYSESE